MSETPRSGPLFLLAGSGIVSSAAGAAYFFLDGGPAGTVMLAIGSVLLASAAIIAVTRARYADRDANTYRLAIESIARGESVIEGEGREISEAVALISEREAQIARAIDALSNGDYAAARSLAKDGPIWAAIRRLASQLEDRSQKASHAREFERSLKDLAGLVSHLEPEGHSDAATEMHFADATDRVQELSAHIGTVASNVKEAAHRVELDGVGIEAAAGALIKNSGKQASDLESACGSVAAIARQAAGITELVEVTDSSLGECDRLTRSLLSAVSEIAAAARSTRRQSQESLKRTKRIGERAQELGRAVFDLEEVADRMNILALNSSLRNESSNASRFLPEIKELADRVTQLTGRVSQLSQFLSTETRETSGSMESVIREVILSSALAEKAGAAAAGLDETASQTTRSFSALADAVRFQARTTEDLARSLSTVSETSGAVRSDSHTLTDTIRSLNNSLLGLTNVLAAFKPRAGAVSVPADPAVRERFIN